jgi:flagellar basal-body rod protein FlgG
MGQMGYTRNGTFSRNGQGTLTTSSGYVVQPEIQIPEGTNEINVSSDGIISVMLAGQSDPQEVGQIGACQFR